MDKYKFDFNPKNCNKVYFKELLLLMKSISPEKEIFKRINKTQIEKLKLKCENDFNSCKTDEFFLIIKSKLY
jgi:hypothetical protein